MRHLMMLTFLLAACAPSEVTPEHRAVVIASPAAARDYGAQTERRAETWRAANVHARGATFEVFVASTSRGVGGLAHKTVVPTEWRGDALAQRAAWSAADRRAVALARRRGFPVTGTPLHLPDRSGEVIEVVPPVDSRGVPWNTGATSARHDVVVCDPSASTDAECRTTTLLYAYDAWLSAGPAAGSTFEVYRVGTSFGTVRRVFSVQAPPASGAKRFTFLLAARNELDAVGEALRQDGEYGSAVAEAAAVAMIALREKPGARVLTVLSDLRQTTPGGAFDFARVGVPPPPTFIAYLRDNRLLIDGEGVDVLVCGVHARQGGDTAAVVPRTYAELRTTWEAVFSAMQVRSVRICSACDPTTFGGAL